MAPIDIWMTVGGLILGTVNLWLLFAVKAFRDELIALRRTDTDFGEKLAAMQVLVAGQYVTRVEFQQGMKDQTTTILNRMEDIGRRYSTVPVTGK